MRTLRYNRDKRRKVATAIVTRSKNEHKKLQKLPNYKPNGTCCCGERDAQIWILRGNNGRMNIDDEPMHTAVAMGKLIRSS